MNPDSPSASSASHVGSLAKVLCKGDGWKLLGLSADDLIKNFFRGNAVVAIVVLALITIFLFREGAGFFGQNLHGLRLYRLAGLEYVDYMRDEVEKHTALGRDLNELRREMFERLAKSGKTPAEANDALAKFDEFNGNFSDAAEDVRGMLSDLTDAASAIKQKDQINSDLADQKAMLLAANRAADAGKIQITPVDFGAETAVLKGTLGAFQAANERFATKLRAALATAPAIESGKFSADFRRIQEKTNALIAEFPRIEHQMAQWRYDMPVPAYRTVTSFIFGREWRTASFWQDWYGIMPLFIGSLLVSAIALAIAVPLGVSAAIYVSEIAGPKEKNFIKPYIEFIAAVPSVVLGFFGIAILGTTLRAVSQWPALAWIPGFPMSERLNALTAGCLLALMSIPTIFSLAEDALNNVPVHLKEASYALGANRLQTLIHILIPASLSGLISAVLLGFGRVIGETMVVLLCAGNRIAIPDFSRGIGAFVQPVHTMTGIIAQEMGEVVKGSIHYRALFMVGVVLFLLSLVINYVAQRVVRRFQLSLD